MASKITTWHALLACDDTILTAAIAALGGSIEEVAGKNHMEIAKMAYDLKDDEAAMAVISRLKRSGDTAAAVDPAVKSTSPSSASGNDAVARQIASLFEALGNDAERRAKEAANVEHIKAIVQTQIDDIVSSLTKDKPKIVHIKVEAQEPVDVGVVHKQFPILMKAVAARTVDGNRLNIWLVGPAGSGKTTAARKAAEALKAQFISNGAISTPYELTGFMNAQGVYVRTPFRDAWEKGGVYLFDEVDASAPSAVTAFNAALSNGHFAFPDGMVTRHADCCVIAGANTSGNGATHEYVGRMKQDKAFLDRFVEIEWPVDEELERSLVSNKDWVATVQATRAKIKEREIKGHMVTPRATVYGQALLAAGIDVETVKKMTLRKGLDVNAWDQVNTKQDKKKKQDAD